MGIDNSTTRGISTGIEFIPILSTTKFVIETFSGKNIITGKKLSKDERRLSSIGPLFGGGVKNIAEIWKD